MRVWPPLSIEHPLNPKFCEAPSPGSPKLGVSTVVQLKKGPLSKHDNELYTFPTSTAGVILNHLDHIG